MIDEIKNKKIILDVDTGIDDAMAIILLTFYLKDSIIGITTCGGNVEVEQTTQNTLAILSLLNIDIPVYTGSKKPLNKEEYTYAKYYHGNNGLMDIKLKINKVVKNSNAEDFIIQSAQKYKNDLIIVSLAPATNIAKAIIKDNSISKYLDKIYLMGGAIDVPGNETKYAETNFFQDPDAIKIILENIKDINIIPLDVTNKCVIKKEDLEKINDASQAGKLTRQIIINWYKLFGDKKRRDFELYDPLAVSALIKPFMKFKKVKIDIDNTKDKGRIIEGNYEINYAYDVQDKDFIDFFIATINQIDKKLTT